MGIVVSFLINNNNKETLFCVKKKKIFISFNFGVENFEIITIEK